MRLLVAILLFGLLAVAVAAPKKKETNWESTEIEDITADYNDPEQVEDKSLTTPKPKKKTTPKKKTSEGWEETEEETTTRKPKEVKKKRTTTKKPQLDTAEIDREEAKIVEVLEADEEMTRKPPRKADKEKEQLDEAKEATLKKTEETKKRSESIEVRVATDIARLASKIEKEAEEIVRRALKEEAERKLKEKKGKKLKETAEDDLDHPIEKRRDIDLTQTEKKKAQRKLKNNEKKAEDLKVRDFIMLHKKPTQITKVEIDEESVHLEGQEVFKNKKIKTMVKKDSIFTLLKNEIKEYRLVNIKNKKATLISMNGKEVKLDVPFANDAIFKKIADAEKAGKRLIISLLTLGTETLIENNH